MKLGYYHPQPFAASAEGPRVFTEVAVWAEEFLRHCERFVLLLNSDDSSPFDAAIPPGAELVDLGPQRPHWMRTLGRGFSMPRLEAAACDLDAVVIQGPTSLLPGIARCVRPALPVFFLVGFWSPLRSAHFRHQSWIKQQALRFMMFWAERQQRACFAAGVLTGNNGAMAEQYGRIAPFHLITHNLVREREILEGALAPLHTPMRLLSLGRLDPEKQIESLLRACARIRSTRDFVLDVVGAGLPSYGKHLRDLARQLGLEGRVCFHGAVSHYETGRFFREADIFVFHTGGTEGFPKVLWEAFANGVPVVASRYLGAETVLTHGGDVLLFRQGDPGQLAEAVLALAGDEPLRNSLARGGRALLRRNTLEASVGQMLQVIEDALRNRHRHQSDG